MSAAQIGTRNVPRLGGYGTRGNLASAYITLDGCSRQRSIGGHAFMANHAPSAGTVVFVAIHTSAHRRHVGHSGHNVHLCNLTMAHLACHLCFQMRAVAPIHKSWNRIESHPGDSFLPCGERSQLFDRRFIFRDFRVTPHAFGAARNRHLIAGVGIGVTELTGELERSMGLVAEGNRLGRCGSLRR